MAKAIAMGIDAGRMAYLAGRMPVLPYASASSPTEGIVNVK
jgi:thiazole synthase